MRRGFLGLARLSTIVSSRALPLRRVRVMGAAVPSTRVAVGQMCSGNDPVKNFEKVRLLAEKATQQECSLLALPECFSFIGASVAESLAAAEDLSGPTLRRYRDLAKEKGLWLSLGGFQEKGPDDQHLFNTHVVLNASGDVVTCYRKIHLFTFEDPSNGVHLDEGAFTKAGDQLVCCDSVVGRLGLTVCYDLRFPHLYQMLRFDHAADILLVPSAFTVPTGKAHWEVLLRARAIETQCYVIAAAQTNRHNHKRESYGHTIAVDPWGEVIFDLGTKEDEIGVLEVDLEALQRKRTSMPLDQHRSAFLQILSEK